MDKDYLGRLPSTMVNLFNQFAALPADERRQRLREFQESIEAARPPGLIDADTVQLEHDLIALTQ